MLVETYSSPYCAVSYNQKYNVVLVEWRKFCSGEDYRAPLRFALEIIATHPGCNYTADTRSGFENAPEDTRWVAEYFMPKAASAGCRVIYFIIDEENSLKDELEGQESDSSDLISFCYIHSLDELEEYKDKVNPMEKDLLKIQNDAHAAAAELIGLAGLSKGDILVVGCSSSEVAGQKIGTYSSVDVAKAVFEGIYSAAQTAGVYLAAQCCEHLNRALIVEKELARRDRLDIVNVVPRPKAGGSFGTTAYSRFASPVAVERITADAGMDIGDTFIGMHLRSVAVPVRISLNAIGEAHLTCARTRPKFIGGCRAVYDDNLL